MTYSDGTNSGLSRRNHYVGQPAIKVGSSNFDYYRKPEKSHGFAKRVAFFAYFPLLILWLETDLKIASGFDVLGGFAFTFLFTIVLSAVLVLLCSFSKRRGVNRGIATVLTAVLTIWYGVQMIYYNVFGTMVVVSSVTNGGAGQAFNSIDMIMTAITSRIVFVVLLFVPLAFFIIFGGKLFDFSKVKLKGKLIVLLIAVVFQIGTVLAVGIDRDSSDTKSNYNLYYGELQQVAVCERYGLYTMQRLDISRLMFGYKANIRTNSKPKNKESTADEITKTEQKAQIMSADFSKLTKSTNNDELKSLYEYFDSEEPSYTNEYTGMFKGYNIIFITAESFSQYAIDKDLTPTLCKMYNEGFQFENYYSPAWGVSTTDGEYANLTGLIPKSGVWSFSKSAENNVSFPFTLGEQSRKLGYKTVNAYHNHTYDYYDRDKYLTNIGYDYSAIGKGLDLGENVWPNSDLKMMQKTVDDYINSDSFSVYYMTVSGHGGYSYNTMSERNADLVKDLKYSDEVKGYLAANIELDKAMEYLLARLEKAGKLHNTLICLTDDHYPYSLDEFDGVSELAGHKVDTTFEQYKNAWLLWSGSMKKPVKVDTYCSSLDILPTLSNMLGLEYDSRMLAGTDVFGNKEPFVVFADRSWISQNGKYNASTGEYTAFKGAKGKDDIDELNNRCNNLFTVSRMILDNNVYAEAFGDTHVTGK